MKNLPKGYGNGVDMFHIDSFGLGTGYNEESMCSDSYEFIDMGNGYGYGFFEFKYTDTFGVQAIGSGYGDGMYPYNLIMEQI